MPMISRYKIDFNISFLQLLFMLISLGIKFSLDKLI